VRPLQRTNEWWGATQPSSPFLASNTITLTPIFTFFRLISPKKIGDFPTNPDK